VRRHGHSLDESTEKRAKTGHTAGIQGIISKVGNSTGLTGYQFGIGDGSGQAGVGFNAAGQPWGPGTQSVGSLTPVPLDTWTLITATYSIEGANGVLRLYINDGAPAESITPPVTVGPSAASFRISMDDNRMYGNVPFSGSIDEVAVYDSALGAAEIARIYRSAGAVPEPASLLLLVLGCGGLLAGRRAAGKR
jgi:hypothetical protein